MCVSDFTIEQELPLHCDAIEQLHCNAFGPGRFARTAFRIRESVAPIKALSFVAIAHGYLAGSVRLSSILIGDCHALLLGPLAVNPDFKNKGAGRLLMEKAILEARKMDYCAILLVGDYDYYARFGFEIVSSGKIQMPGPVNPKRLLLLPLDERAANACLGEVRADI